MFKKIIVFLTFNFLLLTFNFQLFAKPVYAQPQAWTGRCVAHTDVATIQGIECLFANVLRVIMYFIGLAFFIIFIKNGFTYILSGSDQKRLAQVSASLTLSFIGLIGVILSWLIIKFIQDFTGVNVTDFSVPGP